jgi:hypothetical protein
VKAIFEVIRCNFPTVFFSHRALITSA